MGLLITTHTPRSHTLIPVMLRYRLHCQEDSVLVPIPLPALPSPHPSFASVSTQVLSTLPMAPLSHCVSASKKHDPGLTAPSASLTLPRPTVHDWIRRPRSALSCRYLHCRFSLSYRILFQKSSPSEHFPDSSNHQNESCDQY